VSRRASVVWLAPSALVVAGPLPAAAAVLLSVAEAQQAIFPGFHLDRQPLRLSEAQSERIRELAGVRVRRLDLELWRGGGGRLFVVDRVLGKHEEITYAVGIDGDGRVVGVEILEYRETYGDEIRRAGWRAQFEGRGREDALELGKGIDNISGATLSCRHVTDGVRRVLVTRAVLVEDGQLGEGP